MVHNKPQPDTTATIPRATTQARAGALMFPSSCLDGSITRVGPGVNLQCTRAWYSREVAGCSLNSSQPMLQRAQLSNIKTEKWENEKKEMTNMEAGSPSHGPLVTPSWPPRPTNQIFTKENRHYHHKNFSTIFLVFLRLLGRLKKMKK